MITARKLTIADDSVATNIYTVIDQGYDVPVPVTTSYGGLTKREHFAAVAMSMFEADEKGFRPMREDNVDYPLMAKACVEFADALIEALNK